MLIDGGRDGILRSCVDPLDPWRCAEFDECRPRRAKQSLGLVSPGALHHPLAQIEPRDRAPEGHLALLEHGNYREQGALHVRVPSLERIEAREQDLEDEIAEHDQELEDRIKTENTEASAKPAGPKPAAPPPAADDSNQ